MRFLSTIKARLGILPFSILPFVLPLRLAFLCLAFPLDGELLVLAIIFPLSFVLGLTFVLTLSFLAFCHLVHFHGHGVIV